MVAAVTLSRLIKDAALCLHGTVFRCFVAKSISVCQHCPGHPGILGCDGDCCPPVAAAFNQVSHPAAKLVLFRRAKESCHQKRSNVVNTCFRVAIAAATKEHIALPKGGQCTLVVCRAPWRATRNGRHDRGGNYQTCGCRNAARWRYDPPFASLGASKGSADISSRRAFPHRAQQYGEPIRPSIQNVCRRSKVSA
jgi:hypothetical protein